MTFWQSGSVLFQLPDTLLVFGATENLPSIIYTFTIGVTDSAGNTGSRVYNLKVIGV